MEIKLWCVHRRNKEREIAMTTTCYALGSRASRDSILSSFAYDRRILKLVGDAFKRIACSHGSNAVLLVDTSEALVHVESEPDDCDYREWLEEALQEAAEAWMELAEEEGEDA